MNRFFGGLLLGIGVLIAGVSGLCTATFVIGPLFYQGGMGASVSMAPMALLIGGIPFGIGLLLIWAGRALLRRDDNL